MESNAASSTSAEGRTRGVFTGKTKRGKLKGGKTLKGEDPKKGHFLGAIGIEGGQKLKSQEHLPGIPKAHHIGPNDSRQRSNVGPGIQQHDGYQFKFPSLSSATVTRGFGHLGSHIGGMTGMTPDEIPVPGRKGETPRKKRVF